LDLLIGSSRRHSENRHFPAQFPGRRPGSAGRRSGIHNIRPAPAPQQGAPSQGKITYRVLGKTGLKVSTVGYGAMITSDPTVITRAADMGINYFDTSRGYSGGQNERMLAAGLEPSGRTSSFRPSARPTTGPAAWRSSKPASRRSTPTTWTSGYCINTTLRPRSPTNSSMRCARPSSRARRGSSA